MFQCEQCPSVFTMKHNLVAHQKKHGCTFSVHCSPSTFSYKSHLKRHTKNIRGIDNVPAHLRPIPAVPIIAQPAQQRVVQFAPAKVQIAPQIVVPDVPAGGSNMLTEDDMCMEAMDEFEDTEYKSRGSGFTLETIDGLLLAVYKYTPMGGSSYKQLPAYIDRKRATINPQNTDQQCFKWAILAKHVTGPAVCLIGENYSKHEDKYDFVGTSFPTPLSDISKFEKNNVKVSVNVYGLDKKFKPSNKYPTYEVYPLRVVDEEKVNHFDLLSVTDGDKSHYVYIANFSRLIRKQKTSHTERLVFCKRCFTSITNGAFRAFRSIKIPATCAAANN